MGRPIADEYRLRLEGRAELLEAAQARYRTLLEALSAKGWEEQLRKEVALLREAASVLSQVDEALPAALRRAQAEAWPAASPTAQCLREVEALREKVVRLCAQRLARPSGEPLGEVLKLLEERVLTAPRELVPEQRWPTALALLPEHLPVMREVAAFGGLLASVFWRPFEPAERLPFRVDEVDTLRRRWSPGELALASAWSRLSGVDRTGRLVGELRKRAERAPLHPPRSGPERLLHAEFWRSAARKQLEQLVRVRIHPVEPTPAERVKVAWWLCARELTSEARLPGAEVANEARAGLIELAHELWVALGPERSGSPPRLSDADWGRLRERARRADQLSQGADAERVRDVLRTFIWKRAMGNAVMRGWRELPTGLEALVEQACRVDESS